jgi:hypothetical protein
MIDSRASSNVMPLIGCQKINAQMKPSKIKKIQLEITCIKVVGELTDIFIRLSSDHIVHHIIDIMIVDILEAYGLFLSWDWMQHLKGYMDTLNSSLVTLERGTKLDMSQ